MKIILATNNAHKINEIKKILKNYELYALNEILSPFEIEENGLSFKENALIKSRAVFKKLCKKEQENFIVLSDDSGLCTEALKGKPGIYSSRFSKEKTDAKNREKLIKELKNLNLEQSKAHFKAAIALSSKMGDFCVGASLHGRVICEERGENGFGYDALFIPKNYEKTLAQLSSEEKNSISHRFKALSLTAILLKVLAKNYI